MLNRERRFVVGHGVRDGPRDSLGLGYHDLRERNTRGQQTRQGERGEMGLERFNTPILETMFKSATNEVVLIRLYRRRYADIIACDWERRRKLGILVFEERTLPS